MSRGAVEDIRVVFGLRLRQFRKAAGLTQLELAEEAGLTKNYVSSLERASENVSILKAAALADVLDVPVHKLFVPPPSGKKKKK
ncbi:MAG: helix-turn-helix transcriptional regulator [Burkholderiaceae bacterium]